MSRFYYKDSNNNYFSFKAEPLSIKQRTIKLLDEEGNETEQIETYTELQEGYIPITEQEFNELSKSKKPTEEQKALQNKKKLITEKEALLRKYKYDVEQVDLFGMERADYEEKKTLCKQLVLELKELEKELNVLKAEKKRL